MQEIKSKFVVKLYNVFSIMDLRYMALEMELAEGGSLKDYL